MAEITEEMLPHEKDWPYWFEDCRQLLQTMTEEPWDEESSRDALELTGLYIKRTMMQKTDAEDPAAVKAMASCLYRECALRYERIGNDRAALIDIQNAYHASGDLMELTEDTAAVRMHIARCIDFAILTHKDGNDDFALERLKEAEALLAELPGEADEKRLYIDAVHKYYIGAVTWNAQQLSAAADIFDGLADAGYAEADCESNGDIAEELAKKAGRRFFGRKDTDFPLLVKVHELEEDFSGLMELEQEDTQIDQC